MNILLTSAGRRAYLVRYFKEALKDKGKVFASNSEFSIALQEADGYFISSLIYDEGYIDSIIEFCLRNEIKAIISVFDIDLLILAKAKEYIESKGIRLILSGKEVIEVCNDKWKTYLFLKDNLIQTPTTYKSIQDAEDGLGKGEISFPVIIKPRWGMASMAIYTAEDLSELNFFFNRSIKDIENSYLRFESNLTPDEMVLIQEKLNGQEYGLDVINDLKGNYVCVLPKSKLRMRAGETDIGQTVSPERFEKTARLISKRIRHEAILSVDCFDVDGEIFIIEMNCRISGHYPLSHLVGTDLPKQIIEWLEGRETSMDNFRFKEGVRITKDLVPVILDNR